MNETTRSGENTLKETLVEDFGRYIESEDKLSPLAARILAHLIIDNHKGITFEELVDLLKASKSSVFTNLNILLHKGRITYYTLAGDRKKYYTVSPDDMINRMNEHIKSCANKLTLCRQIIAYKKSVKQPGDRQFLQKQLNYLESFIQYLEQHKNLCIQHKEDIIHLKTLKR